ncbi:MAG: ATP-dependent RecD-like DNA helicase [Verrucomicrobiaceae bacterium]|nr:ATP-dependent RecD-like DNA helicase [Verrucomicrobiaceae bacterium]
MKVQEKTLSGTIERVTFHNEENGYCVLRVSMSDTRKAQTVVGNCAAPNAGEEISARGEWIEDDQYGSQFKASEISTSEPDNLKGIERYLGSGLIDGIGPTYAKKLVKKFGPEVFNIIDDRSKRLEEVEGIGPKRRQEIKKSWEKQKSVRRIMVFLHQHGISTARAVRIYKTYGDESIKKLRNNPYRLSHDLHGVGFKTADAIASKLGINFDDLSRIEAGLHFALQTATGNGHCALPEIELIESATELLGVDQIKIEDCLKKIITKREVSKDEINSVTMIFPPQLIASEKLISERILNLASRKPDYPKFEIEKALSWCQKKIGYSLAQGQRKAVELALRERVLIITGGPGVGKTTILRSVLMILRAKKVAPILCAPTGRAAKRMSESTGLEASTIHRLLEFKGHSGKFSHDENTPVEGDLFIVDEASMIDTQLMSSFLRALPKNAHLILVGDVDQLPSVGPGSVLSDMINSNELPVARLNEIFRQSSESRIITAAHEINEGILPIELTKSAKNDPKSDFFFISSDEPEKTSETIANIVSRRIPENLGLDPVNDIQVITPMHRGSLGTQALNRKLQDSLNPANESTFEIERFGARYRVGDKVIQTRNNYDKETLNGDIGKVIEISTDPGKIIIQFSGQRTVSYEPGELDEISPAFAITVHKSQGSEFPCVVIPVSTQHFLLLQRNLLYTAITRGSRVVVLVGQKKAAAMAVKNIDTKERYRGLLQRLIH